jgi:hypothetical protein
MPALVLRGTDGNGNPIAASDGISAVTATTNVTPVTVSVRERQGNAC